MSEAPAADPSLRERLLARWPYLALLFLGAGLLWPVPLGRMPMSADHTVHLARVQLWADILSQGSVRGWSWAWFMGAPIGEFYPPLGDLLVILPRALSFGLLGWPTSYALAFTFVFCLQGWALCFVARRLGLAALPAFAVGALALLDPGYMREGGWLYTVTFGVWPQVLSTSALWIGIGLCLEHVDDERGAWSARRFAALAIAWGASLLAHPAALPTLVLFVLVWLVCVPRGETRGRQSLAVLAGAGLALVLALWWLFPMLGNRAWMASYGWLYASTEKMVDWALGGAWTHHMPPSVGYLAAAGLLLALVAGSGGFRALALYGLGLWLLASRDVFWLFRLDLLSEGFTHIQFQRFLLAAKPAFYLLAFVPLVMVSRRGSDKLTLGVAVVLCSALLGDAVRVAQDQKVGEVQVERRQNQLEIAESDVDAAVGWLNQAARGDDDWWRVEYRTSRNDHTLADLAPRLERPLYKSGFTPGDNFVHKPESAKTQVRDPLRVRYVLRARGGERPLPKEVARFGNLRIVERALKDASVGEGPFRATLIGEGKLEVLESGPEHAGFRLTNANADTRVRFSVAGHPRWRVRLDGRELPLAESPLWGDGPVVSFDARRSGALRGGKAMGDDGSEPIALTVTPGADGELRLEYQRATLGERLALLLSALAWLLCITLLLPRRPAAVEARLLAPLGQRSATFDRLLGLRVQVIGGLLGVALLAFAWSRGAAKQAGTLARWEWKAYVGDRRVGELGPLKTDMLIRPALRLPIAEAAPVELSVDGLPCDRELVGWIALDDDWAKQRERSRFRLSLVDAKTPELASFRHGPGRQSFRVPAQSCVDGRLKLRLQSEGKGTHTLGLWLRAESDKVD